MGATRSLATFVRSHRSLRSLAPQRSASLRTLRSLAPFTGSLTHFAHSLEGQLKFLNMCSYCYRVSRKQTRFWHLLETRPLSSVFLGDGKSQLGAFTDFTSFTSFTSFT